MVEGAVAKFLAEVTLLAQPFVKGDGKETVGTLVKDQGATVNGFVLFVVGEGIEKKKGRFRGRGRGDDEGTRRHADRALSRATICTSNPIRRPRT